MGSSLCPSVLRKSGTSIVFTGVWFGFTTEFPRVFGGQNTKGRQSELKMVEFGTRVTTRCLLSEKIKDPFTYFCLSGIGRYLFCGRRELWCLQLTLIFMLSPSCPTGTGRGRTTSEKPTRRRLPSCGLWSRVPWSLPGSLPPFPPRSTRHLEW